MRDAVRHSRSKFLNFREFATSFRDSSLFLSHSLFLSPSHPINNRALCAPTGDDPYTPIIRSRLQPFDAGAPGERGREEKREISSADLYPYHVTREPTPTDRYCTRGARTKTHGIATNQNVARLPLTERFFEPAAVILQNTDKRSYR